MIEELKLKIIECNDAWFSLSYDIFFEKFLILEKLFKEKELCIKSITLLLIHEEQTCGSKMHFCNILIDNVDSKFWNPYSFNFIYNELLHYSSINRNIFMRQLFHKVIHKKHLKNSTLHYIQATDWSTDLINYQISKDPNYIKSSASMIINELYENMDLKNE